MVFFKECLISFLMISRLIDFALGFPQLLMFKVRAITEILKIVFFNFPRTESVKQNQKK